MYARPVHEGIDGFEMPHPDAVRRATDALRLLADPTRLKILYALVQGETSVACLAELVGAAPTAVSQHLAKLRLSGLVETRREGTFIFYSPGADVRALLAEALALGTPTGGLLRNAAE